MAETMVPVSDNSGEGGGSGITCGAINCDHNKEGKCGTQPEISAGGACMTYSKGGGEEPNPQDGAKNVMQKLGGDAGEIEQAMKP